MDLETQDIETIAIEAARSIYENVPPLAAQLLGSAKLYAAAPKMLAALQGIEKYAQENIEDIAANAQEGGGLNLEELRAWNAVINAIEEAREESALLLPRE